MDCHKNDEEIIKLADEYYNNVLIKECAMEENMAKHCRLSYLHGLMEIQKKCEEKALEMKTIAESLGFTTQEECDEYNQMVSDLIMSDDNKR